MSLILIIIGSLILGSVGWSMYTKTLVTDTHNHGVTSKDIPPSAVALKTEEGKEKPSVLQFTNNKNEPIGQLTITDSISFQGQLDTSGLIFMSYVATQMGLHCDELKEKSPVKSPDATSKQSDTTKKK